MISPLNNLFSSDLIDKIEEHCSINSVKAGTQLLGEDQYVKILPIVISGLVKVYSRFDEKELLLYYIEPLQSCVMTFYAALSNAPSRIFASTEEDSEIIFIPVELLPNWLRTYPEFNQLFYSQYNMRYVELIDTIGHLLIDKLDKRLYDHLKRKAELTNSNTLKLTHQQLANELGTSREVVTRIIKKLQEDELIEQLSGAIKII